jgi:hypothetical protein
MTGMRSILPAILLLLAASPLPSKPSHLKEAERIAHGIDAAHNGYAHKDCFIKWIGENGATQYENRTDCSDFLNLLLEHVYGKTAADFKQWTGHARPVATVWYDTIASEKSFKLVATVEDILPGDVIAVQYPPGGDDTGHIMLAAGLAVARQASKPLIDGAKQWELLVIDSSKSGHGKEDTRRQPDGTFARGVGEGTLRLYTGADGTIAGYAWSTLSVSKFVPVTEHKVIVGRLLMPTAAAADDADHSNKSVQP